MSTRLGSMALGGVVAPAHEHGHGHGHELEPSVEVDVYVLAPHAWHLTRLSLR